MRHRDASSGHLIIGVDEVGYGCIAGPVCAGVAVCRSDQKWSTVKDSKKMTPKQRDRAFDLLRGELVFWAVVFSAHSAFKEIGVLRARLNVMQRAALLARMHTDKYRVVVDGNIRLKCIRDQSVVPKADDKFPVVSAASIMAKVIRDRYMTVMAYEFPGYGFEKHKGYGTPQHLEAIRELGPCSIHRTTYPIFKELTS